MKFFCQYLSKKCLLFLSKCSAMIWFVSGHLNPLPVWTDMCSVQQSPRTEKKLSSTFLAGRNLVTPLCSPTTYEGLLDDVFGIQSGKGRNFLAFCFSLSLSLPPSPSPIPRLSLGLPSTLSLSSSFLSFSFHFPSLILDIISFSSLILAQFVSLGIAHSRCVCWSLYCHFFSVILHYWSGKSWPGYDIVVHESI